MNYDEDYKFMPSSDFDRRQEKKLSAAQAEIERLRELVEVAHAEGWAKAGGCPCSLCGGNAWAQSKARATLSTPPVPQSTSQTELETIRAFFAEVDKRAAQLMLKSGVREGAHYNAMKSIIAEREAAVETSAPAERDFEAEAREILERWESKGGRYIWINLEGRIAYSYKPLDETDEERRLEINSDEAVKVLAASRRRGYTYDT